MLILLDLNRAPLSSAPPTKKIMAADMVQSVVLTLSCDLSNLIQVLTEFQVSS